MLTTCSGGPLVQPCESSSSSVVFIVTSVKCPYKQLNFNLSHHFSNSCTLREALAGEGAQAWFSVAFGCSAAQPPPAQPQRPRVELLLQSQRSPQPHTVRSAVRNCGLVFITVLQISTVWFNFRVACIQVKICTRSQTMIGSCWELCISSKRERTPSFRSRSP